MEEFDVRPGPAVAASDRAGEPPAPEGDGVPPGPGPDGMPGEQQTPVPERRVPSPLA